jgi:cytochrome c
MKLFVLVALSALTAVVSASAVASTDLARKKNCMACHSITNKIVGPSFKEVAKKYAGQAGAEKQLADHIRKGSSGVWGVVPMPANAQVNEEEAATLVKWILQQK